MSCHNSDTGVLESSIVVLFRQSSIRWWLHEQPLDVFDVQSFTFSETKLLALWTPLTSWQPQLKSLLETLWNWRGEFWVPSKQEWRIGCDNFHMRVVFTCERQKIMWFPGVCLVNFQSWCNSWELGFFSVVQVRLYGSGGGMHVFKRMFYPYFDFC